MSLKRFYFWCALEFLSWPFILSLAFALWWKTKSSNTEMGKARISRSALLSGNICDNVHGVPFIFIIFFFFFHFYFLSVSFSVIIPSPVPLSCHLSEFLSHPLLRLYFFIFNETISDWWASIVYYQHLTSILANFKYTPTKAHEKS